MAHDFVDEAKIKDMFDMFDADGGGTIDVEELTQAFINLGISDTKEEIDELVKEIDTDGSGEIEYDEFRAVIARLQDQRDSIGEMQKAFFYFSGGKERITLTDLRKVMNEVGDHRTDLFLQEMFIIGDTDRDGIITFQDFKKLMETAIANERQGITTAKTVLDTANERDGVKL
jgi:Ca2+-binding EF-hand superfamily protein